MIAVTDISTLTDLDAEMAVATIALTKADVNQIPASAIINSAITQAVKNLLNSILDSTAKFSVAAQRSAIATYAGFQSHNGTVSFNAANVSLDKLTFYVIFRLPFSSQSLQYQDPVPESASVPGSSAVNWGKYANYIRSLNGSGILKINSAGEQINSNNKPVDSNSQVIDGWYNQAAYNFLGEDPFNGSYTVPPGLYSPQTEKLMLFGQNTNVPNAPGEQPLPFTKIPLYFYLLAKVENPYSERYWLNPNKDSQFISRTCHWPATVTGDVRRHFVKLSTGSNIQVPNGTYPLLHDNGGTYFQAATANGPAKQKLYILPMDSEALSFENLSLNNGSFVQKTDEGFIASWNGRLDVPSLSNNSGLTIGMGVDIGAGNNGIYNIVITLTVTGPANGTFRLYYGGRRTSPISAQIDKVSLNGKVNDLIDSPGRVTVTSSTKFSPFQITILREYSSNEKAYNHRIFAADFTNGTTVSMSPANESSRWVEKASEINNGFYFLSQYLSHAFSNSPTDPDYWLTQLGSISNSDKDLLKSLLKKASGCRSKAGYYIWDENKTLLKKIEFKSYIQNLRSVFNYHFLPKFYQKTKTDQTGKVKQNAPKSTVKDLLDSSNLKTTPNQAELFAIVLLNYNYPRLYSKRIDVLINAINSHSKSKLLEAIKGLSSDRITALSNFMGTTVISKLYHGLTD